MPVAQLRPHGYCLWSVYHDQPYLLLPLTCRPMVGLLKTTMCRVGLIHRPKQCVRLLRDCSRVRSAQLIL
ncbi:hypothetical protein Y032_0074g886 [Ancylostoma ceylanicum]|uniref:Uncharacterized protein n=1 Tax=Ancylostoma ceylanicum TaxID=53326 RepID=A0A016TWN2_9BILA|nr:hypothetical protein Y032_0074g886 [Ancylostoma ceylanicum]